jgi:hypothetical protein
LLDSGPRPRFAIQIVKKIIACEDVRDARDGEVNANAHAHKCFDLKRRR